MRALQESRRQTAAAPTANPDPNPLLNGTTAPSPSPSNPPPVDNHTLPPTPTAQVFALQLPARKVSQSQESPAPSMDTQGQAVGPDVLARPASAAGSQSGLNGMDHGGLVQNPALGNVVGAGSPASGHQKPAGPAKPSTSSAAVPNTQATQNYQPPRPPGQLPSHTQAAQQAQAANNFYVTLNKHLTARGQYFPPGLFQAQPAPPGLPGGSPTGVGHLDVGGKKLDLMRLWYTTMQQGGHTKVRPLLFIMQLAQ